MINPVSSSVPVAAIAANIPKAPAAPAVAKPVQDSVHSSPQALAAVKGASDVDHDGDSH